jgi:disease resistance protein RPM1
LRYLQLSDPNNVLQVEEIGSLKFLQTLDIGGDNTMILEEVTTRVCLPTELLCLRFRTWINTLPDGIGMLTSLEELEVHYGGLEEEAWRRFVKELCGLRELRVLRLDIILDPSTDTREVHKDAVLQFLRNLQKLEILSLMSKSSSSVQADTAAWEAESFHLPRRLRRLSVRWITFPRFSSCCINPSRLSMLSELSLRVGAMDEQGLRILGGLPQLHFLDLVVYSIAEVVCDNTRADDDACIFQNLRRCSIWYKGVRFLLPSQEESRSVSFCTRYVGASMILGSQWEDTLCRAVGVAPTLMPSAQKLWFTVCVQEFIKDVGNHDDGWVSLALGYFASLQNVQALIDSDDGTSAADVEQVEAALRRAADVHPNRPTVQVIRTVKALHSA